MRNSILNRLFTHGGALTEPELIKALKEAETLTYGARPNIFAALNRAFQFHWTKVRLEVIGLKAEGLVALKNGKISLTDTALKMVNPPLIASNQIYDPAHPVNAKKHLASAKPGYTGPHLVHPA